MKSLSQYIEEDFNFRINRNSEIYSYKPTTWDELKQIVDERVENNPEEIDLTDIDVSNITSLWDRDMYGGLFADSNYVKLKTINVKGWNTSNITNLQGLFYGCKSLVNIIGLETWDISNVKNMGFIFYDCENLIEIPGIEKWQTPSLTTLFGAFEFCYKLKNVDLSNWDVSGVKDMSYLFCNDHDLKSVGDISGWEINPDLYSIQEMFKSCKNMDKTLDLSEWALKNMPNVHKTDAFLGCKQMIIPKWYNGRV